MADITQFLGPVAVGGEVKRITGDLSSSAAAAGYSAWIQSVTGTVPAVSQEGNRATLNLSSSQSVAMQQWLDKQVKGIFQPAKDKPPVNYNMGQFLTPWAVKYFIPAGIGMFALGWIAAYYLQR